MSKIMEDLIADEKVRIAVRMLEDGVLTYGKIAEYAGLSVEEVEELKKKKIR